VPFKARNECWVPQLVDKSRIKNKIPLK